MNNDPYMCILGATMRTGSTLFMRMANVKKELICFGEMQGSVCHIKDIENCIRRVKMVGGYTREYLKSKNDISFIANLMPRNCEPHDVAVALTRTLFMETYSKHEASGSYSQWGFKDVYYGEREINLIRSAFPGIKIVLVTRHPHDVWLSATHTFIKSKHASIKMLSDWNEHTSYFHDLSKCDDLCELFKLEDVGTDINRFCEFIGIDDVEIVKAITSKVISGRDKNINKSLLSESVKEEINNICNYTMAKVGYQ